MKEQQQQQACERWCHVWKDASANDSLHLTAFLFLTHHRPADVQQRSCLASPACPSPLHPTSRNLLSHTLTTLFSLLCFSLQPAEDLRLYKEGAALEEGKTLAELRMQNDDELAVAFRLDGEPKGPRAGARACHPASLPLPAARAALRTLHV